MLLLGSNSTGSHGGEVAEAVDFDGTNDYLGRSFSESSRSAMTFSAWVWPTNNGGVIFRNRAASAPYEFSISITDAGVATFKVTTGNQSISALVSSKQLASYNWNNILFSFQAGAGRLFINDDNISSMSYTTGEDIKPLLNGFDICLGESGNLVGARVSHVFLDYTYRDLSQEANRRLFITSDRKPADNQAALNPILYLKMESPDTVGVNSGTGGNFQLNGVVARSGRGPNQFNAPYSTLDGSADYLSRTSIPSGISDGKQFTFHAVIKGRNNGTIIDFRASTTLRFKLAWVSNRIDGEAYNASGTKIFSISATSTGTNDRNYIVTISVDLSSSLKRFIYVNGIAAEANYSTYTNDDINFNITSTPRYYVGNLHTGELGNVFFHTSYIDLSIPANLAKFCTGTGIDCKPVDMGANGELPLGTSPLIYLPMYANNAGKNYGTGGDFTVNSGPYTGARGPNEFFGNKADFDGSTGYLARTSALAGVSDSKTFSLVWTEIPDTTTSYPFDFNRSPIEASQPLRLASTSLRGHNSAGIRLLGVTRPALSAGVVTVNMLSVDLSNVASRHWYINGVSSGTWSTYIDGTLDFSAAVNLFIGCFQGNPGDFGTDGKLSEFYFSTEYIDFSQEANRLKFRDAFGNPVDLTAQIEAGEIPNPAIYLRFDPANQGKNYGTGGDFVKSGTILDGGQL